jgi:hypothetical protein
MVDTDLDPDNFVEIEQKTLIIYNHDVKIQDLRIFYFDLN